MKANLIVQLHSEGVSMSVRSYYLRIYKDKKNLNFGRLDIILVFISIITVFLKDQQISQRDDKV